MSSIEIDQYAFANCKNLRNVQLSAGIVNIHKNCFENNSSSFFLYIWSYFILLKDDILKNSKNYNELVIIFEKYYPGIDFFYVTEKTFH